MACRSDSRQWRSRRTRRPRPAQPRIARRLHEGDGAMHLLKSRVPTLWLTARRNRREIITAGLSRRELFKMGLLTSGGYLAAKSGLSAWASGGCDAGECQLGCSPPTTPFIDPLRIPPLLPQRAVTELSPAPRECPNNAINPATGLPFEG